MTIVAGSPRTPMLREDEVLAAVRSVRKVVEANAADAEQRRTLPPATMDALDNAGLLALRSPREVGGSDISPLVALAAYEELTSYDTSAGWVMAIGNGGAALAAARLPEDGLAEVFSRGVPRFAGSYAPTGIATLIGDGVQVSGRWGFASGIRHADWVTGGCVLAGSNGPPGILAVVMSASAVRVIDNWHVAGLQGTGSCDWEVTDRFVAGEHTLRPYGPALRGGPAFRMPLFAFIGAEHAGFALGCARRSLAEVTAHAGDKVRLLSSTSVAARSAFQRDLGRAEASLRSARLLVTDVIGAAFDVACRGDDVTAVAEADIRVAAAYATGVAVDICTIAFRYLGAHALALTTPVQRYFRDMHAAAQHVYVADTTFEDLAKLRLGLAT